MHLKTLLGLCYYNFVSRDLSQIRFQNLPFIAVTVANYLNLLIWLDIQIVCSLSNLNYVGSYLNSLGSPQCNAITKQQTKSTQYRFWFVIQKSSASPGWAPTRLSAATMRRTNTTWAPAMIIEQSSKNLQSLRCLCTGTSQPRHSKCGPVVQFPRLGV